MASKGAKHAALLLTTLLGAARASPQDKPPAGVQSSSKKHHGVPHGLTVRKLRGASKDSRQKAI